MGPLFAVSVAPVLLPAVELNEGLVLLVGIIQSDKIVKFTLDGIDVQSTWVRRISNSSRALNGA